MSEIIKSDECIFWVKAVLALQITRDGVCSFAEKEMKTLKKSFDGDEDHFERFLRKLIHPGRVTLKHVKRRGGDMQWTFNSKCESKACVNMFKSILENHAKKNSIIWQFHDPKSKIDKDMLWWILAKLYMPYHNENSTGPKQVDPLSVFSLLTNCKLFDKESSDTRKVIELRNKLMHHTSNKISENEMKDAFSTMKALLTQERIKETSEEALQKLEEIEQERFFLTDITPENDVMIIRALEMKEQALEHDMNKNINTEQSNADIELMLKETREMIRIETNNADRKQTEKETESPHKQLSDLEQKYQTLDQKYNHEKNERLHKEKEIRCLGQRISDLEKECQDMDQAAQPSHTTVGIQRTHKYNADRKRQEEIEGLHKNLSNLEQEYQTLDEKHNDEKNDKLHKDEEIRSLGQRIYDLEKERQTLGQAVKISNMLTGAIAAGTIGAASGMSRAAVGAVVGAGVGAVAGPLIKYLIAECVNERVKTKVQTD